MVRYFVLGNENILVGMDKEGRVRDFYYPYVGQENHVNGKFHKLGVWVDGIFSWFSSSEWKKTLQYKKETLVTQIISTNEKLGVTITLNDTVCHDKNIFIRRIDVKNNSAVKKNIKLFFHQQFELSEANLGDTVYFNPLIKSLVHYKGKRYFLINGEAEGKGITEYATGLVGEYGLRGTYVDAEDGVLSNNPIEHGSVDSTASFHISVPAGESKEMFYWICVGENFGDVEELNSIILKNNPGKLLKSTENYWKKWVNKTKFEFPDLSEKAVDLFKRSLLIINTHIDKGGAIIASSDSDILFLRKDTYNYMWPRDGALVSRSLDRAGYSELTENFFKFCNRVITKEGYLFHKYRPDGSLGSSWHSWVKHGHVQLPIQEDQIALVLDALWKHFLQHGEKGYVKEIFNSFIRKSADFMLKFMDKKTGLPNESYDLWEEKLGIHTFTCSTVYAGFIAAANFEKVFGTSVREKKYRDAAKNVKKAILKYLYDPNERRFIKMVYYDGEELKRDMTVDASSTYGIFEYEILGYKDERVLSSLESWKNVLHCNTPVGGYARYLDDYYHRIDKSGTPGNPWLITTLWLAEYYIAIAETKEELKPALEIIEWVTSHALESGVLPEQLHPYNGDPISVAPLTWSHAAFVIAINKYLEKLDNMGVCKMCNPPLFKDKKDIKLNNKLSKKENLKIK